MKAAVLKEFGAPLAIEELPTPTPADDEVLIQLEACGVCHSDLHIIDGDQPVFRGAAKQGLIPGHEAVGRIVAKGSAVSNLEIGQRVGVAWLYQSCGACEQCLEGNENLCRKGVITGLMVDGGYAQFMRAKASHAIAVPDALGPEEAAPLFCAGVTVYRALKKAGVASGQRVAVFGVGGLGHLAVQIAKALGAEVIGLDVSQEKLALATELGAARVLDAADSAALKALAKAGGVHVAVVTSAAKAAFDAAMVVLRPTGTLAVVGLPAQPLTFAALALVGREIRVVGSAVGTRDDLRAVLEMAAAGKLRCRTESQPLDQVNQVLDRMRGGSIYGRVVLRYGD
ncbi:MAG TPA: alcohol dehydrogenase catalytic domain-containing protein [Ramlibacter sp.]|nr:alcohol dehydrogenase catalytic domain-containing protein [Ramlibacter sp.]